MDLSVNLNLPLNFNHPAFKDALKKVGHVAKEQGKAAGILLPSGEHIPMLYDMGYRFIAVGSDGGLVMAGMKKPSRLLKKRHNGTVAGPATELINDQGLPPIISQC